MNKIIRLIIAEEQNLVRKGYVSLIQKFENFYIIGEVENGQQLIDKYFELKPDIILSGISMPVLSGLEALKEIAKRDQLVKAIILSMYTNEKYIYEALKIGVKGFLSKSILPEELKSVITKVYEGGSQYLNYTIAELEKLQQKYESKDENPDDFIKEMTSRQKEILFLIAKNYSSREIAEIIGISKRSVDIHRNKIVKRFKFNNPAELVSFALRITSQNKI